MGYNLPKLKIDTLIERARIIVSECQSIFEEESIKNFQDLADIETLKKYGHARLLYEFFPEYHGAVDRFVKQYLETFSDGDFSILFDKVQSKIISLTRRGNCSKL